MKASHFTFAALALAPLAACNEAEPLSPEEVLARAQSLPRPDPGLYRITTTLVRFEMSEPAAADTAWAEANMVTGTPSISESCLAPEDAARGFAPLVEAMAAGGCAITRFDVEGNRMGTDLTCENPQGTTSQITMIGTGSATGSQLETRVVQSGPAVRGGTQEVETLTENERIGECYTEEPSSGEAE
ncbi:MAG: DUF3617 family protein [Erythrobacter sp.]|nr:MAG: DUF3617 family protein [Erythrobacter sp.]